MLNNAIFTILKELAVLLNEELKIKFKNGYQEFWLHKPISQPMIMVECLTISDSIPIVLYLAERGFSAVATLITKNRNRLHVTERGD